MPDFIGTIDSDDDGPGPSSRGKTPGGDDLDPDFKFDLEASQLNEWEEPSEVKDTFDLDDIIAKRKRVYDDGMSDESEQDSEEEDEDEDEGHNLDSDQDEDADEDGVDDNADINMDVSDSEVESDQDEERKRAFFDDAALDAGSATTFASMNLSRPILRALSSLSFNKPTPIQAKAIPLALLGRDILGAAQTGSGKTAAFMIPVLERLTYRDKGKGACRVLVLCPTRELAVQCETVGKAIATRGGLDVRFALLVGGLSLNAQAHALRTLPDILIATPGRLIDHLTNTPSFTLSALDILVIDEADRILEAGFSDELGEIIKACPRSRQTMLFSATMTDSVDELVRLSLQKPIRVFLGGNVQTLVQEFVRIRAEDTRSPSLLALCKRTIKQKCIVFFRSKALAHQMRVVFGLCGLKAAELHGNLTQDQRLSALSAFKAGTVDYLLATDLASRGLDIKGVETVINYDMPGQLAAYTHRVGRTARAGRNGRSITLVGEADRKMLKAVVKNSANVKHRVIPTEAIAAMSQRLGGFKDEIQGILREEKEEKAMKQADMEIRKGQNLVAHEKEIFGRPARTWFQSEREKRAAKMGTKEEPKEKSKVKRGKYEGMSRRQKRRKMAMDDDAKSKNGAAGAAIRAAKRGAKPQKITHEGMRAKQVKVKL